MFWQIRITVIPLFCATLGLVACAQPPPEPPTPQPFQSERESMVRRQIEARGVHDPAVLKAMRSIPRDQFVPENVRAFAYLDQPLPIGYDQTISQPFIVAIMTQLLEVKPDQRVLEIGTGSGYQAAVLSVMAKEVYTIEIVPELAHSAAETLRRLGYTNAEVKAGDGYLGWPEHAPFDRIMLTAAPPEIPQVLIDELKPGGKLVAPVGVGVQNLVVLDKSPDGKTTRRSVLPVLFVPMKKSSGK
jgi:protein-L-isoaspartate(D-aspartate) O-methyltransferase